MKRARFVSIISDGSTDRAIIEQETVLLRYVVSGSPVTRFIQLVDLEHANAAGIFDSITEALKVVDLSFNDMTSYTRPGPCVVSANFDGASVMMGSKSGVATRIKQEAPHVIPVHCVAHTIELAVLDAVKNLDFVSRFEETLKGIYNFYHFSPKRRRDIKQISDVLDQDLCHFTAVKQVRWVASKSRAIAAVANNLPMVVMHLEHVSSDKQHEYSARAKGYLKHILTTKFVKTLYVFLDFMPLISAISKIFQKDELLVLNIEEELLNVVIR